MIVPWEKIPIFAGLKPEALEFLTTRAGEVKATAGEIIINENDLGNRMFIIRSGEVRVWKGRKDGTQVEINRLKKGDFFGEMCILETLPRVANVEAVADTVLSSLSAMTFYQFYQALPAQYGILVLNIARDLSRRLRKCDEVFAATH